MKGEFVAAAAAKCTVGVVRRCLVRFGRYVSVALSSGVGRIFVGTYLLKRIRKRVPVSPEASPYIVLLDLGVGRYLVLRSRAGHARSARRSGIRAPVTC